MAGIPIGVTNFYYGLVKADDTDTWTVDQVKRIKFLNEITVESEQDVAKAFGDGSFITYSFGLGRPDAIQRPSSTLDNNLSCSSVAGLAPLIARTILSQL